MPELPEVETVRRAIAPALEGRRLEHVEITDARLTRPQDPLAVAAELTGERVERVDRRGKYLVVRFASGRALLIHLRMTGSLLRDPAGSSHLRAILRLDDGTEIGYRDIRRFGTWLLVEPGELEPDCIHTPGIFVQRILQGASYLKSIEHRTVRKRTPA
jgi:formamidopyrimidine-DNA glycosylase